MSAFVDESINLLLRSLINNILEINEYAIPAKENFTRPSGAYASVDIVSIVSKGFDVSTLTDRDQDLDINNDIEGYREVMISFQFYKTNALENAHKVHIGLMRNSTYELFYSSNLGYVRRSDVRDISERLENGWENRAQFDLVLSTIATDNEIIKSIQSVTINGEFQTRGKSIPIEKQV